MTTATRSGINRRGEPGTCMAAGCTKRALYANPRTKPYGLRGYCDDHKAMATPRASEASQHNRETFLQRRWGITE